MLEKIKIKKHSINMFTNMTMLLCTLLLLIMSAGTLKAQVGGNDTPLLYSTQTYRVTMGYDGNSAVWRIYSGHPTVGDIENGTVLPLVRNIDYTAYTDEVTAGEAIFRVRYDKNMAAGDYTVVYRESYLEAGGDECLITILLPITIQPPFDVDVALQIPGDAATCPELSDQPLSDISSIQTTIPYLVTVENPDAGTGYEGSSWSFGFTVQTSGVSGSNATIASVSVDFNNNGTDYTLTPAAGVSNYTNMVAVNNSTNVSEVLIAVTFNDVLGVTQNIRFDLSNIGGTYLEIDTDPSDRVDHIIYGMPDVGLITALN